MPKIISIRKPNSQFLPTAMPIFNFQILLYSSLSIFFCFLFPQTHSLSFNLTNIGPQHQNVNIKTFGDAKISSQGLQLAPIGENIDRKYRAGKAQWVTFLHLWDNSTGSLTDFDTHFVFAIDSGGSSRFGDGFTFFLADPKGSESSDITPGLAMGLPVNRDTFMGTSSFVAVEFDTARNVPPLVADPDYISPWTHVGIDVNSIISNVTAPWYCNVPDGIQNEAWIRYDSSSHDLSVVFTGSTNTTRVKDTIHLIVDLRDYLPEWVTFGFSAATGEAFEKHTVISWEFSSSFQVDPRPKKLPFGASFQVDPRPKKLPFGALVGIVVGSVVLVGGLGWVGFGLWKRSRENGKDKSEVELPTKNFPYGELRRATNEDGPKPEDRRFVELPRATNEDGPKLEDRRFGGVYRGFFRELDSYIAVKTTYQSDAH